MRYIKLLRPRQWVKNFLVFAPLFFGGGFFVYEKLWLAAAAFAVFCLSASSIYILNDLFDKEDDKNHPRKKNRPIASGVVSAPVATALAILFIIIDFAIIYIWVPAILWLIVFYVAVNILYSFYLKRVPILDLLFVSSFYLLRVEVGGLATDTRLSNWLVLCVIFASLLIVTGKRLAEAKHVDKREVLCYYSDDFLKHLLVVLSALVIVSYGLYSILGSSSEWMVYSIFLVLFSILRYLLLVYTAPEVEEPEKLIFKDKVMLSCFLVWLAYAFLVFYF